MRGVNFLVIHCSDTPNGASFTARDIDQWHAERVTKKELRRRSDTDLEHYNGSFPYIAYHDVIGIDGFVYPGRGENEISSANGGIIDGLGANDHSLSVCMIGTDKYSSAQWTALKDYVTDAERRYGSLKVLGHRDVPGTKKPCPGFSVADWRAAWMQPLA